MKKNYLLSLLFALFLTTLQAQDLGCLDIIANDRGVCEEGLCATLEARPPINRIPRQTNDYLVSSTPFVWRSPDNINDITSITTDDRWSQTIPLRGKQTTPFNFCFFGEKYSECLIGDNGAVTFSIQGHPDSPGGLYAPNSASGFNFSTNVNGGSGPGYGPPYKNAIMMLQDLLITGSSRVIGPPSDPLSTQINYFTVGTYPCRAFVANWQNVPLFGGGCVSQGNQSYQIVLFESTNIIEVHVRRRTSCSGWINGAGTLGIQNQAGNIGYAAPGRDTSNNPWNVNADGTGTTTEAWRFSPNGALVPITYAWSTAANPGVILATTPTLTVCPEETTLYQVVATFGSCDPAIPPQQASDLAVVRVGEAAGLEPQNITHCDTDANPREFNLGINTDVVLGTFSTDPDEVLDPNNYDVGYYLSLYDAENDIDNLYAPPTNNFYDPSNTAAPVIYNLPAPLRTQIIYVRVTDIAAPTDCHSYLPFTISIRSCDETEVAGITMCDVANDNTENFDLTDNLSDVEAQITADGFNTADYTLTYHESLADTDDLSTALTPAEIAAYPSGTGAVIYVRASSVTDPSDYLVYFYLLTLNPNPTATIAGSATICEGSTAPINFSGTAGATVTYTDETGATQTITLVDDGTGTNTGTASITSPAVVAASSPYNYTLVSASLTTGGLTCVEPLTGVATIDVGPQPTAAFSTTSTTICEGDTTTIGITGTIGATVTYLDPAGTAQTIVLDGTGSGSIVIPNTTTNGSYTYTLDEVSTAGSPPCTESLTGTVTITVDVLPTVTISALDTQVCLGVPSRIRFQGTALAIVDYTLNGTPNSITLDASGAFILTETLPIDGVYDYELVSVAAPAPSTCNQTQTGTASVTVIGAPDATIAAIDPVICENTSGGVVITGTLNAEVIYTVNGGTPQTVTLTPSAANPAIGEATISSTLAANTTYSLVSITTTGANPCTATFTGVDATITVNPLPTATIALAQNTICENDATSVLFTGPVNGEITYSVNSGTPTTLTLDATGNFSLPTGNLTTPTTYTLLNVESADTVPCSQTYSTAVTVQIKALPTATFTGPVNVCQNRPAELEFTGTANSTVTFTADGGATTETILLDAAGYGLFTTANLSAATTFDLISIVSDGTPACPNTLSGSVTVNTIAAPVVVNPTPLEICDDNEDGIAFFNLRDKDLEITGGPSTLIVTYHETMQNAIDNAFPKQDFPYANLVNASPELTPYYMYVRVEEPGGSACPSFVQLRLIVNRTPQPVSPDPIEICDDATADGLATFPDITIREVDMIADLNPLDTYNFFYYINQADAEATVPANPPIASLTNFNNSVPFLQTIWIRVENAVTGCFKAVPMDLIVNPNPVIPAPGVLPEYTLCDINNPGDEIEEFDLEDYKRFITTEAGMDIKFYFDAAAYAAGTELPLNYENEVSPAQTILVVVTNGATGCVSQTTLTLRVEQLPLIIVPAPQVACDPDNNGTEQFDLDSLIPGITGGADYTITFHETSYNAENNLFPYTSPYSNLASGMIWIRAVDNNSGCFSIAPMELIVNPAPTVPPTIEPLIVCDTNEDGTTRVNLQAHIDALDLLTGQPAGTYTIRFYTNEIDADAGLGNNIPNPTNYLATDGQQIWVRITNTTTNCFNVGSFTITINPALAFAPVEYSLCDEGLPNDGFTSFDLTTQIGNLTRNLPDYEVAFYTLSGTLIDPASSYTNATPGAQTLNVVIKNTVTGCVSYTTLTIRVEPLPNPRTDPQDLVNLCDNGVEGDGIGEGIDLTVNETYIRNGATPASVAFYYYTDLTLAQADAAAGTFGNAIPDPTDYSGPSGTIYVLMTTNANNASIKCSQMVQFDIIINPIPALGVNGVIPNFVACVGGATHTFTLSDHNSSVLDASLNVADYTFTYYDSQINAEAGGTLGVLPNSYPNTTNPEAIWVRVQNNVTGCFNVGTFNLIVDEPAVANPVPDQVVCDDLDGTNDGFADFDLSSFDATVLGTQTPPDFTVHYYLTEADAILDGAEGPTTTNSRAITDVNPFNTATTTVYALVINRNAATGCPQITPINLIVNQLPVVTLQGGFFCVDPTTLDPLNSYELVANVDGGANPADYTYQWFNGTDLLPDTGSSIFVDEVGTYSVIATNIATGCISAVTPESSAFVDATSAPIISDVVVSGYFTDNATITVEVDPSSLGNYEFRLITAEGGPTEWQTSNVFGPVAAGTYLLEVRDLNNGGCVMPIPIEVMVINYPKFFTPNGDGYNDTWTIRGLGPDAIIYIFDRYGKLVKTVGSEGDGWDGTMNGHPLPSTDYWFKVLYTEGTVQKEFRAHFSLKR